MVASSPRSPDGLTMAFRMRLWLCAILVAIAASGAQARDPLGLFDDWGAFRDARPPRCFAIATPARSGRGAWKPFAAVATWPAIRVRGQLHVRLRNAKQPNTPVWLMIGDQRYLLASGGADAWAPDPRTDAVIVAAMRGGSSMSIEAVDREGRPFADIYRLRGAATAIDAAALGCARAG